MRSSKRRVAATGAMLAAIALTIAGCTGGAGGATATSDQGGTLTGKLVVWDQQYANTKGWSKVMDDATAAFEAAHKGVTIQHVAQTTEPAAYTQLLQAAFQAKTGPDIVMMQPAGDGVYIYKEALAPLESYVDPALVKSMVGTADTSADGHLYGLPDGIQGMVIFYNKALFAKAGLDPKKPPTTVQEFMTDSAALKAAGITPIGGGNATGGDLMVWAYSTFNPSFATAKQALQVGQNKIKFTDPTVMVNRPGFRAVFFL
jgi:ABC-type glycerol-3-phosphate transport system substrate-binding protein